MSKALELQKLSNKSSLKRYGASYKKGNVSRENYSQNISDKLQFSFEIAYYRKSSISVIQEIFTSSVKIFVLDEGRSTRQSFYEVLRFS